MIDPIVPILFPFQNSISAQSLHKITLRSTMPSLRAHWALVRAQESNRFSFTVQASRFWIINRDKMISATSSISGAIQVRTTIRNDASLMAFRTSKEGVAGSFPTMGDSYPLGYIRDKIVDAAKNAIGPPKSSSPIR